MTRNPKEKTGNVKYYWHKLAGNVTPFRTFKHPSLVGSIDLALSKKYKKTYVLNPKLKSILILSHEYNSRGREKQKRIKVKRIKDSRLSKATSITTNSEGTLLAVNHPAQRNILIIDPITKKVVKAVSAPGDVISLETSPELNSIIANTQDGQRFLIKF
jgi:hypothetical protein